MHKSINTTIAVLLNIPFVREFESELNLEVAERIGYERAMEARQRRRKRNSEFCGSSNRVSMGVKAGRERSPVSPKKKKRGSALGEAVPADRRRSHSFFFIAMIVPNLDATEIFLFSL